MTDILNGEGMELVREHWVTLVAVGVVFLVAMMLIRRIPRRRAARPAQEVDSIDLAALPDEPLPPGPPVLEFYHLPVRLVAVVLAPVGRVGEMPPQQHLVDVVDSIVPGLDQVAATHRPAIVVWPRQVSSRGFAHAFFQKVPLPGEPGAKTAWSSVAGLFRYEDEPMMAGLVLRSENPNRHGTYIMEKEDQWLGILRVRLS